MKFNSTNFNRYTLWFSIVLILSFIIISPIQATTRSHTFELTLFISGLGMQVGSTILNTSAQERYEDYLAATIQDDIQNKKIAAANHQNASVIMRRVGYGCIGLAVAISIFKQIDGIETNTIKSSQMKSKSNNVFSLTDYKYKSSTLLVKESPAFKLRPHYDFQKQRASISLLHNF
ncbi:hypothetical protein JT359_04825 [Candidatus Poribacteria bacterium]|nr:hypothetical protein [Candidatus Poribacteria bacterium]